MRADVGASNFIFKMRETRNELLGVGRSILPERTGITWTRHVREKMRFYRLSEARVKRVLRNPQRIEKGIVPRTIAIMQRTGTKKRPTEIWVMYQNINSKSEARNPKQQRLRIITAWRYPGRSPVRDEIPIPGDIMRELRSILKEGGS